MPSKTKEQFRRTLERKDDVPKAGDPASHPRQPAATRRPHDPQARQSEMPVSRRGMHQESQHHKHNDPGQSGHGPQKHSED
jgi:hypothetical protein